MYAYKKNQLEQKYIKLAKKKTHTQFKKEINRKIQNNYRNYTEYVINIHTY